MLEVVLGPLKTSFSYIVDYWWTVAPFLLGTGAYWSWMGYKKQEYLASLSWTRLEIKPPPDVEKSPKIAENIFSGLHSAYLSKLSWKDQFFGGKLQPWFSFEIVGTSGQMRFYVVVPESFRNNMESLIFSQYPEAEIKEADDYVNHLPEHLPNDEYDLFGTELVFTKPNAYPIKTYIEFEEPSGGRESETKRTDPLAPLAEQISTLQPGEHIWLQMTIRATGADWTKAAQPEIDKILGKEVKVEQGALSKTVLALTDLVGGASAEEKKEEKRETNPQQLTPGQRYILESVERKVAKLGFKSGIRFMYIGRRDAFHRSHVSGVVGMFKQLYLQNLNSFKPNKDTMTSSKGWLAWLFPSDKGLGIERIEHRKKSELYQNYRKRFFTKKFVLLNTEELATLWHLPGAGIKAPMFPRVESKKGQPPAGLPTK